MTTEISPKTAQILGINLNSTSKPKVLKKIIRYINIGQKILVVTPNPEFLVYAWNHLWFRKILNQADLAVPDGSGLILAARFLGRFLHSRVAGADLVSSLMTLADAKAWRVGFVGARGRCHREKNQLLVRLQRRYPGAKIFNLETRPDWFKKEWHLVLACQGMARQERWLAQNFPKVQKGAFIGAGSSLDYLTGFARRAPTWLRQLHLEWLWRFFQQPRRHACRIWRALVVFPYLIIKEKLGLIKP